MDQLMLFIDYLPMIDYVRAWSVCKAWLGVCRQWKKRRYPFRYCFPQHNVPSAAAFALMSKYGLKWRYVTDVSHPIVIRVVSELGETESGMFFAVAPYGFRKHIVENHVDPDHYIIEKLDKYYRKLRHEPELFTRLMCRAYNFVQSYRGTYVNEMNDYLSERYP